MKGEQILLSHSTATLSTAASPATLGLSTADIIGLPHCYCSTCSTLQVITYYTVPHVSHGLWTDITGFRLMEDFFLSLQMHVCTVLCTYIRNIFRFTIKSTMCVVCCVLCVRCNSGVGGPVVEWRVGQQYYLSRLRGLHLTQNTVLKEDCRLFHRKGES